MAVWRPIETAPDDFDRSEGRRHWRLLDARTGEEITGRQAHFNNSGWAEKTSNREFWPTHWMPLPGP